DGGVPQTGDWDHPGWTDAEDRRLVSSIAVVDPASGTSLLFDATPDLPEQLRRLHSVGARGMPEIFLTHAHMGHYTGLMWLGHESLGAQQVSVHGMPRMSRYLEQNGPWSQLVVYENIVLQPLAADSTVVRGPFRVTPILVPHRQEFSEVVGYRIEGPERSVLFIPDIDSWEEWDAWGRSIEEEISRVDLAYLDATFFGDGEIPGRDMSGFPHPFITHSMERFDALPAEVRSRIRFIHLNHTNPALWEGRERTQVLEAGFGLAREGEIETLLAPPTTP
ncbi:MAG: MBL fold metallo-hydrolase, partial [Rhodothermales bacterium]|nr:MBL fold metallo-hydrolase [Rhodothermales bacterium]